MTQSGRLHRYGSRGAGAVVSGGTIGKPVIHSEDLATDLVCIDIGCYGLADPGKFVAGNRADSPSPVWSVVSRIPPQLRRRHPRRMDSNEHFPAARSGHRSCARDQRGASGESLKRMTLIVLMLDLFLR
jgi:hypothetical protein